MHVYGYVKLIIKSKYFSVMLFVFVHSQKTSKEKQATLSLYTFSTSSDKRHRITKQKVPPHLCPTGLLSLLHPLTYTYTKNTICTHTSITYLYIHTSPFLHLYNTELSSSYLSSCLSSPGRWQRWRRREGKRGEM